MPSVIGREEDPGLFANTKVSSASFDINEIFVLWVRPFLETCLFVNNHYRSLGEQDEALLLAAAWKFFSDDIASNRNLLTSIGTHPAESALAKISPEHFRGITLATFIETTGIPRNTASRRLDGLVKQGRLQVSGDSTYRLASTPLEMLDLAKPTYIFARWMLVFCGLPPSVLGEPGSLLSFGSLVRHYLAAYVELLKGRRVNTGNTAHIGVQLSIMLLHSVAVDRQLTLEGPSAGWGFRRYQLIAVDIKDQPYFIRELAALTDLPVQVVRRSCRQLEELGFVAVKDNEAITVGGTTLPPEVMGAENRNRRMYSVEMEQSLVRFTRNALARAERLAKKSR
jgi:predicted transcriptional regulator